MHVEGVVGEMSLIAPPLTEPGVLSGYREMTLRIYISNLETKELEVQDVASAKGKIRQFDLSI